MGFIPGKNNCLDKDAIYPDSGCVTSKMKRNRLALINELYSFVLTIHKSCFMNAHQLLENRVLFVL